MVEQKLLKDSTLEEILEAAKKWIDERQQDLKDNFIGQSLTDQHILISLTKSNTEDIGKLFAFVEALTEKLLTKEN